MTLDPVEPYLVSFGMDTWLASTPWVSLFYVNLTASQEARDSRVCIYTFEAVMRLPVLWDRNLPIN